MTDQTEALRAALRAGPFRVLRESWPDGWEPVPPGEVAAYLAVALDPQPVENEDGSIEYKGTTYFPAPNSEWEDNHCESGGGYLCDVHPGGRFAVIGNEYSEVCDLSPVFEEV